MECRHFWCMLGTLLYVDHYFSWDTEMFGRNPVAVLATNFLLSHNRKLLRTIITAMSFTYLDYPGNVPVWLHDGNVGYIFGGQAHCSLCSCPSCTAVSFSPTLLWSSLDSGLRPGRSESSSGGSVTIVSKHYWMHIMDPWKATITTGQDYCL